MKARRRMFHFNSWLLHLFTSYEPKHRCFIPNCDTKSETGIEFNATYLQFALPKSNSSTELLKVDENVQMCLMAEIKTYTILIKKIKSIFRFITVP